MEKCGVYTQRTIRHVIQRVGGGLQSGNHWTSVDREIPLFGSIFVKLRNYGLLHNVGKSPIEVIASYEISLRKKTLFNIPIIFQ